MWREVRDGSGDQVRVSPGVGRVVGAAFRSGSNSSTLTHPARQAPARLTLDPGYSVRSPSRRLLTLQDTMLGRSDSSVLSTAVNSI